MTQAPHEIRRIARGPDDEASRLYAEFGDKIYRFCLGRLRSREEAEDAVQNTFLRVCTALRKGVVPEFEGPWLYKIAHNVCLSRRLGSSRRAKVEAPADLDLLGDRAAAYTPDADELFGLDEALAEMPANLRRPLLMREWQGMSYAEIAEAIGVSHSAVETLIFRARRHLAQALTDQVKKTGRAVASVFNLRWLFNLVKGLGGGAGTAGMAASAAGLVVAIGGGVAVELATQHAGTSRAAISSQAAGSHASSSSAAAQARSGSAAGARAVSTDVNGNRAGAGVKGSSGSAPGGSSAAGRSSAAGPSSSGGSSSGAAPPSSSRSSTSKSPSGRSGSGAAVKGAPRKGSGGAGGAIAPPTLPPPPVDPGSIVPPVDVPGVPPVPAVPPLAPPSVTPPPLPSPPTITTPGNLIAEATGPLGAVVAYTVTATDVVDGTDPVTCAPGPGATFHLGHTTVSCSSTDKQGATSHASFDVLVQDTTAPTLTVPADITVQASLTSGVKVTFTVTAADLVDTTPKVSCSPASGSVFLIQTTTVTCTATDTAGNSSSKEFAVTVKLVPPL